MSILIDESTKVLVQGITGHHGSFHAKLMMDYGADIVAGVTPGKANEEVHGVPVYGKVKDALNEHKAEWSVIFVPAKFAKDAAIEALQNGLNVVIITEGVPVHDTLEIIRLAEREGKMVLGPNCPGMASVGKSKIGIIPKEIFSEGNVGVVSRSGTLTYEIVDQLSQAGIGQSTIAGIGGDKVVGLDFVDILDRFEDDKDTKAIVLIGEIGGVSEQIAAERIRKMDKPVVAYITGKSAPQGKKMGHAGAIAHGEAGRAEAKIKALREAGARIAETPGEVPELIKELL